MKQIITLLFAIFIAPSLVPVIFADSSISDISCIAGKLDSNAYSIEVFAPLWMEGALRSVELVKREKNIDSVRIPLAPHATNSDGVFIYLKIDERLLDGAFVRVMYESLPPSSKKTEYVLKPQFR